MGYHSYERSKLEDELEPAARDIVQGWKKGGLDHAAMDALEGVIAKLDKHDEIVERKRAESQAREALRRALIDRNELTPERSDRCGGENNWSCSRKGGWTFPGSTGPRCKVHATKVRDRVVDALMTETYAGLGYDTRGYYSPAPSVEITRQAAERLGVELPA